MGLPVATVDRTFVVSAPDEIDEFYYNEVFSSYMDFLGSDALSDYLINNKKNDEKL